MNRVLPILLSLLIAACSGPPELTEQQKSELVAETTTILERAKGPGPVNEESWGEPIRALKPKSVYSKIEGIYIKTGGNFVTEYGLFFPRSGTTTKVSTGTDPRYHTLGRGIYWYEIKG